MVPRRLWLGATLLSAVLATEVLAQNPPPGGGGGLPPGFKMPSREEIRAQVQAVVAASDEETIEIEGVIKIKYKKVPTDPNEVAKALGKQMTGGQALPPGAEGMIKQFEPMIAEVLNESLGDIGKLEAKVELKLKSKRIPVGEWKIGLQVEGERPVALLITGDELNGGKPVELRLKTRAVDPQPHLKIEFKTPKDMPAGNEKFDLQLTFMRFEAKGKTKVERAAAGAAPAAGGDKEDKDDKEEPATPPATPPAGGGKP